MDPQVSGRMDQPDERGGAPEPLRELIGRLESDERWDQLADVLDDAGRPLADGPSGPALRGEWLGHALHPLMTDLPLGCWTSTSLLDLLGGRSSRDAARRLVGLGVVAAMPTAVTGLVELTGIEDRRLRRVGAVHAAGNSVALVLYAMSWRARRHDHHLRGTVLALCGGSMATFTGFLGGHLSFGRGVGVEPRGIEELDMTTDLDTTADLDTTTSEETSPPRFDAASAPMTGAMQGSEGTVSGMGTADLLGVEQVARELTVPVEQVHAMVEEGLLPAARVQPLGFRPADVAAVRLQGG